MGEGLKYDQGKLRFELLPTYPLKEVVKVLTYGANKYDDHNWKKVAPLRDRYYAAAMRHIIEWWEGEDIDPESGCHHLAHAMCCLIFLMEGLKDERGK